MKTTPQVPCWVPVGPRNIGHSTNYRKPTLFDNVTIGDAVDAPSVGANLSELTDGGFTLGAAITSALLDGDTTYLMLGSNTSFSGDDVVMPAQYGYDRFQRADHAHVAPDATINAALAEAESSMVSESSDSGDAGSLSNSSAE